MPICIWCKTHNPTPSLEHIIPEALGCPAGFFLDGGIVCQACNSGLAHLDAALAEEFDFATFIANVPRKGGRPPAVLSRGNVMARVTESGPEIHINMEPHAVTGPNQVRLAAYKGQTRNIKAAMTVDAGIGNVSFDVPFGQNPKFVRALHKIALSTVAFFLGPEAALNSQLDPVRSFVVKGSGSRHVLYSPSSDKAFNHHVSAPYASPDGHYVVGMRLAMVEFIIDLSPTNGLLDAPQAQSMGTGSPFFFLPPKA